MRPPITLAIPQPCHENWAAMTPTVSGRHCGACQKTVVDFTLKTDAEILAYLARAVKGSTCGRFAAGQLERPLQRAAPAAPTRWRAWLAAAVALWSLREAASTAARAQTPIEWPAQYWGGPVPATLPSDTTAAPVARAKQTAAKAAKEAGAAVPVHTRSRAVATAPPPIRGVVTDFATGQPLPGYTVLMKGTVFSAVTNAEGRFEIPVPASHASARKIVLTVSSIGYTNLHRTIRVFRAGPQVFQLRADVIMLGGLAIVQQPQSLPAPWKLHQLIFGGKNRLT